MIKIVLLLFFYTFLFAEKPHLLLLKTYKDQNPPAIGDEVTFKYKEFTKKGMPRFPVFLRVRDAK